MREEYFEALAAGRKLKARWIVIRWYLSLAVTVILYIGIKLTVQIVKTFFG
jgi:hypothetical protein